MRIVARTVRRNGGAIAVGMAALATPVQARIPSELAVIVICVGAYVVIELLVSVVRSMRAKITNVIVSPIPERIRNSEIRDCRARMEGEVLEKANPNSRCYSNSVPSSTICYCCIRWGRRPQETQPSQQKGWTRQAQHHAAGRVVTSL